MTREIQSVILVLLGGALLRISLSDVYLRYVKEGMKPWLIISGVLLVVGGLLALAEVLRAERRKVAVLAGGEAEEVFDQGHPLAPDVSDVDPEAVTFDEHGHAHGVGGPKSAWLLLLPVAAIFLVAPPALGAFTAERQTSTVVQPKEPAAPPLPAGDPVPITLADYAARAVWDDGRTLKGRNVEMVGFVTPNAKGGGWYLTRLQLTCCAADAIATKISPLDVKSLPANTWVQIVGQWVPGGEVNADDAIPLVKVTSLKQIAQPSNAYE